MDGLFYGYLAAWLLAISTVIGAANLLMVHVLSGGRWGWSLRRPAQKIVSTMPLMAVLFIPVVLGMSWLYPWVYKPAGELAHQRIWLNTPLFIIRAVIYFALFIWGGWVLSRHRPKPDQPVNAWPAVCSGRFAAGGLVILALLFSFAGIDWLGSLEPRWYSTVFGLYLIIAGVLSAHALMIIWMIWPIRHQTLEKDRTDVLHDLGNILLTLVCVHAYLAFSQFFLIWNGNLPAEILWFEPRLHGVWGGVYGLIALTHFFLPFWVLLFRVVKRTPKSLLWVAGLVLAARVLDAAWMVIPAIKPVGVGWVDLWAAVVFLVVLGAIGWGMWVLIRRRDATKVSVEGTLVLEGEASS